jgi:hypothetical protein
LCPSPRISSLKPRANLDRNKAFPTWSDQRSDPWPIRGSVEQGPFNGNEGEAKGRAFEKRKRGDAGLVPAPVPNSIRAILDRIWTCRLSIATGFAGIQRRSPS